MRHTLFVVLLVACALAAAPIGAQDPGQGKDAATPAQPVKESPGGVSWFPLELDRRWHYKVNFRIQSTAGEAQDGDDDAPHSLDVYVTDPQEVDGRQVACMEWKLDGQLAQRCYFVAREEPVVRDGPATRVLYCVKRIQGFGEHMKDFSLIEPMRTAHETLAVGDTWVWQGKTGATAGRQTFKVVREEDVTTTAGTFHCLVLQMEFTGDDESRGTTTRWLARGVGIVREESEVRTATSVFRTEGTLHRHEGGKQ